MSSATMDDSEINTTSDDDNEDQTLGEFLLVMFFFFLLPCTALAFVCCLRRNRRTHSDLVEERLRRQAQIAEALASANPTQLRLQVLRRLVPRVDDTNGSKVLSYDTETQVYRWNKEAVSSEESCSICLEYLSSCCQTSMISTASAPGRLEKNCQPRETNCDDDPEHRQQQHQSVLKSKCGHAFHWECIWGWITVKDECPYCRQPLWDAKVYQRLQDEILLLLPGSAADMRERQETIQPPEPTPPNDEATEE